MSKIGRTWKSPIAILLVVFCVVFVGSTFARRALARGTAAEPAPRVIENWADHARTGHVSGSAAPTATVLVFADYQCVGCAAFHQALAAAKREMSQDVRVVTRHFPLSIHAHAASAANAAECAAEQGRFEQMEDALYAKQDSIGVTAFSAFAIQAGVRDTVRFNKCVKTKKFDAAVERDRLLAKSLSLKGTPTYLVNGLVYFGAPSQAVLMRQLRDAGSSARTAKLETARAIEARNATDTPAGGAPARRWLDSLSVHHTISGDAGDELLVPGSIAATADGNLVVFDYGAMEVRVFSRDGKQLWREGRSGAGPGEYRNVMDVEVRSNGQIALLDMVNRRISTLSSNGKLRRTIPLELNSSRFVATADTSSYTLAGDDSSTLWVSVNENGKVDRRMAAPSSLIARHSLAREQFTASLGTRSVMAYRWSDRMLVLESDGGVQNIVDGIERVALPDIKQYPAKYGKFTGTVARVDPTATPGALSVATNGNLIYVLFAGRTKERGRIVDVYDADAGTYLGSHLLPVVAQEIALLSDGSVVALRMEPVPALDVMRPSPVKAVVNNAQIPATGGATK